MGSLLRKKVKILINPRLQVMHAYQNPLGTSVVIQWLRLHDFNAGSVGSISGWGTKIPYDVLHSKLINQIKI